jgi:hypothetical protein
MLPFLRAREHPDRRRLRGGPAILSNIGGWAYRSSKAGLEGRTIREALPAETCAAIEPDYRAVLAGHGSC